MKRKKFPRYQQKFWIEYQATNSQTFLPNIGIQKYQEWLPLRVLFGIRNLKSETTKSWISLQIDASHVFEWLWKMTRERVVLLLTFYIVYYISSCTSAR